MIDIQKHLDKLEVLKEYMRLKINGSFGFPSNIETFFATGIIPFRGRELPTPTFDEYFEECYNH